MSKYKSAVTIDALPAERLGDILVLYAADFFYTWTSIQCGCAHSPDHLFKTSLPERDYCAFAEVTRVCRRWRAVALGHPEFWSNVVVGSYRITKQAIERSRNRPLDVFGLLSGPAALFEHDKSLRILLNQLSRVRSLQLCLHPGHHIGYAILYNPITAPSLVDLSIHFFEYSGSYNQWNVIRKLGSNWVAPRLRRYKVWGGTDSVVPRASYPAIQFKASLTQLIWLSSSPVLFSSTGDILSLLRELPSLDTLHISFAHPPAFADAPVAPSCAQVKMPRLRRLVLKGGMDTAVDILSCLSYPRPLQQFGVSTWGTSLRAEDETHVAEFLSGLVRSQKHGEKVLQTLSLRPSLHSLGGVELMAWSDLRSPLYFPDGTLLPAHLSRPELENLDLYLSLPEYFPESYLKIFFEGFQLSSVQSLQFGFTSKQRRLPQEFLSIAQLLTEVRTLAVTGKISISMLASCLVGCLPMEGPTRRSSECYFPNLRCLRVTGLELSVKELSAQFDALERLVATYNLDRLVFNLPVMKLSKHALIKLSEVVGEVFCDDVADLPYMHNKLYRIPQVVEGNWEVVGDRLQEEIVLLEGLPVLS